jgi:hypothetical protein
MVQVYSQLEGFPKDITLIEHPMATFWFDENGILHSVSKSGSRTVEVMNE